MHALFKKRWDSQLQEHLWFNRNEKCLEKGSWREAGRGTAAPLPQQQAAQVPLAPGIPNEIFPYGLGKNDGNFDF